MRENGNSSEERRSATLMNSMQASIDYHDYMLDAHHNITDYSYVTYHRVMADTYRALNMN